MDDFLYKEQTYKIRGACFKIWREFGGAFKESIIDKALTEELLRARVHRYTRLY